MYRIGETLVIEIAFVNAPKINETDDAQNEDEPPSALCFLAVLIEQIVEADSHTAQENDEERAQCRRTEDGVVHGGDSTRVGRGELRSASFGEVVEYLLILTAYAVAR